jgi:Ca2+:H+ antiporter
MVSAFSAARKNRLDMSVGIAMGSSSQIALFVAPVLVMISYACRAGAHGSQLRRRAGADGVVDDADHGALVVSSGRSAWYLGVQLLAVYAVFAVTFYSASELTGGGASCQRSPPSGPA